MPTMGWEDRQIVARFVLLGELCHYMIRGFVDCWFVLPLQMR